ncbi:unnamed protein product, partial [Prorocentrum cordatum]
ESPEGARALLQDNPQLCYALLQAQLLLGLTTETVLPPDVQEPRAQTAQRRPSLIPGIGIPRPAAPRPVMTGGLLNFPGLITARPGVARRAPAGHGLPGRVRGARGAAAGGATAREVRRRGRLGALRGAGPRGR